MSTSQKLCCVCGEDVASKKRIKDQRGNYYCEPCFAAKRDTAKQPATVGAAVAAPAAQAVAPLADEGMLDLAPEVKPHVEENLFGCASCKKLVPERQIRNLDGEFICNPCFSKRNQPQRAAAGKKQNVAVADDSEPSTPGFGDSILGGLLFTIASIAGLFGAVFAFQFAMALPMPAPLQAHTLQDVPTALSVAALYSFWNFGFALIAWIGVIIAVKVGNVAITLGATLWRTFALCAGITFLFRIQDQFLLGYVVGIVPAILFAVRYTAFSTGLAALLRLEGIPRRLVALVSMLFSEVMGFLFYAMLTALVIAGPLHTDGKGGLSDDDEEMSPQQKQKLQEIENKIRNLQGNADNPAADTPADKPADKPADNAGADNKPAGNQ